MTTALVIVGLAAFGLLFWKLVLPDWRDNFRQLADYRQQMGSARFWAVMAGTLAFIGGLASAHMWLSDKIGWPDGYGFYCHRKCMFQDMWHSPALLENGTPFELGMFAVIWWPVLLLVGCLIYALLKRRGRNPISPMHSAE